MRISAVNFRTALLIAVLLGCSAVVASGVVAATTTPHSSSPSASVHPAVSEGHYEQPVPEPGDAYFEAEADDGSWVSYINPRDDYRSPYLGDGSGKICITLVNEAGDPVVGESIPNTTATIDTGDELEWHDDADPFVVEFPLSDHYDRPLDADQFGTDPDIVQGDGYLDSHCLEWHGLPEDETVSYGELELEGDHTADVEVVGYIQQAHDAWDSDVDPISDAQAYEEVGGWTYETEASHGQVVAVLQLDGDVDADTGGAGDAESEPGDAESDAGEDGADGHADSPDAADSSSSPDAESADQIPGFGPLAALLALSTVFLYRRHW